MRYKIPASLTCEACTLQWYWSTGNTCFYDGDYLTYFRAMEDLGWNAAAWAPNAVQSWATRENTACNAQRWQEEFWNCADISIVMGSGSDSSQTAAPTAAPTSAPTSAAPTSAAPGASTTEEPEPSPEPEPTSAPTVAEMWGQCSGRNYEGPTQCVAGATCMEQSEWYGQCVPSDMSTSIPAPSPATTPAPSPATTPAPSPATTSPASSPTPSASQADAWAQCGGNDYNGPTECIAGHYCNRQSEWYSQCVPGSSSNPAPSPATTPAPSPASGGASSGSQADAWAQCGGNGYSGPTECIAGHSCNRQSEWYSQCVPTDLLQISSSSLLSRKRRAVAVKPHQHHQQ
jgi:hypothetical protein